MNIDARDQCRGGETEEESENEVLQETEEPEAKDDFEPLDELGEIRKILDQEKRLLHAYLEVGVIPERTVFRQKIIVAALAAMICDLEGDDQKGAKWNEKYTHRFK